MGSSMDQAQARSGGERGGRPVRRRGGAAVRSLVAAAGRAVGRSGASERGTVLLMVIGVLAMMSIVALVYASIGQADRRSAAALASETRLDDQADVIADYIAGVLAADLFSYHVSVLENAPSEERFYREVTDYPSSNPNAVSRQPGLNEDLFDAVGHDGYDPWLSAPEPGRVEVPGRPRRGPEEYLNLEDWPHISNLSPDGRFVNLVNLRNNFRAAPGTDENERQINSRLTLYGFNGLAHNPGSVMLPDGSPADPNVPAHWTENQIMMHRPAVDIDRRPGGGGAPGPDEAGFAPNQYADADGDGMFDSRWFELVGRDPNFVNDLTRSLSPVRITGPARIFVASRVIDLSGLVNVNTATEFTRRPERNYPAGLTPADVDLRRLLRMQDFYDVYGEAYDGLEYDLGERLPTRQYFNRYLDDVAHELGDAAYSSLRHSRQQGPITGSEVLPYSPLTAEYRFNDYDRYGFSLYGDGPAPGGALFNRWFGRPFGIADELELRTYHGANDSATLSRFEATVAARFSSASTAAYPLCPVRSTRPLSVEVGGRGDRWPTGQSLGAILDGRADDEALLLAATDIRRLMTFVSGSRPLRPVELDADPLSPTFNMDVLEEADLRLDLNDVLRDIATGQANADAQLERLFATYATSLAPHLSGDDNRPAWDDPEYSTLAYGGRGPQLALEFAAHMTANAVDMFDRGNGAVGSDKPTALTVKIRSGATPVPPLMDHTYLDLDTIDVPGQGVTQRLDPTLPAGLPPPASEMHVYGIEAQPFITEMAAFHLYTDTPIASGGDTDWEAGQLPGEFTGKVTIHTEMSGENEDFIMQVVAIQVHNPFQEDIDLRGEIGSTIPNYYFQFAEEYYQIPDTAADTILRAGETRVFYATNPSRAEIRRKWENISPAGSLDEWLGVQLGLPTQEEIDDAELSRSKILTPGQQITDYSDMFADAANTTGMNHVVHLWREFGDPAIRSDDILADRLRDPATPGEIPTWDRRIDLEDNAQDGAIPDSASGPEGTADNTGLTVMMFGTVRRPDDPNGGGGTIPLGAIPAYCIERKDGSNLTTRNSLNVRNDDNINDPDNIDIGNFGRNQAYTTFAAFVTDQLSVPIPDLYLKSAPDQKSGSPPPTSEHPLGLSYDQVYPEIHLNNDQFQSSPTGSHSTMRLGDALLPLAVGPQRYIIVTSPPIPDPAPVDYLERQWTTLSEALAMATGFGNDDLPGGPGHQLYRLGVDVLDRGHLRTDAFAPFYKASPPANYANPWVFDETANDEMRYPGIPLAQHLLGQFRAMKHGTERQLVPGLININTAPLAVLRLLPMFTPERDAASPVGWMTDPGVATDANGNPISLYQGDQYDVAAMVKAYRDKTLVVPRGNGGFGDPPAFADALDFQDATVPDAPFDGRRRRTFIEGLREQTGFAGVGEILSVMQRQLINGRPGFSASPPALPNLGSDLANSVVRFGHALDPYMANQEGRADILGVDSTFYESPTAAGVFEPDEIVNDYDEQLTIANAVLNTISTRSDVFCVWFVVHGYLPTDVEGLADGEPMVPSIARRYIMIVDRSNVVRLGEKPKILLFQELPL